MTKERLEEIRSLLANSPGNHYAVISGEMLREIDRLNQENRLLSDLLRDTAIRLRAHTEHVENLVEKTHGR